MGWFYDTVSMAQRDAVPGSVTGKPTALGGMARHGTATAMGVIVVARHLLTATAAHDVQISSRGLEDAFIALTGRHQGETR